MIRIEPTGIRFEGKHTKLFLPVNMISELTYNWSMGGSAIAIQFAGVPPFSSCLFVSYAGGLSFSGIKKAAKEFHAEIEAVAKPYLT